MKPIDTFSHKDSKSTPIDFYKAMKLLSKVLLSKKNAVSSNYSHFQMLDKSTLIATDGQLMASIHTELPEDLFNLLGKKFLYTPKTGCIEAEDSIWLRFDSLIIDFEKNLTMFLLHKKELEKAKGKMVLFKTPNLAMRRIGEKNNIEDFPITDRSCTFSDRSVKALIDILKGVESDCIRVYSDFVFKLNDFSNLTNFALMMACDNSGNPVMKGVASLSCGLYSDEEEWANSVNAMAWNEMSYVAEGVEFLKLN